MDKNVLEEYVLAKNELKILEQRIEKQKNRLAKIREQGTVVDTVSGGNGGIQHFRIEGYPVGSELMLQTQIEKNVFILQCRYNRLLELMNECEEFISQFPIGLARSVADFYIIDGLGWSEVAKKMGPGYTPDQCRMIFTRALQKLLPDEYERIEKLNEHEYERGNA